MSSRSSAGLSIVGHPIWVPPGTAFTVPQPPQQRIRPAIGQSPHQTAEIRVLQSRCADDDSDDDERSDSRHRPAEQQECHNPTLSALAPRSIRSIRGMGAVVKCVWHLLRGCSLTGAESLWASVTSATTSSGHSSIPVSSRTGSAHSKSGRVILRIQFDRLIAKWIVIHREWVE